MTKPYPVLRAARWMFLGLAYLFGGLNLVFGLIRLVAGGQPVALIDGSELPMRLLGALNILGAPLSFLLFYLPSGALHLLLDLHQRASQGRGA